MKPSPEHNVVSLLDDAATRHPERPALIFGESSVTFAELQVRVSCCAHELARRGLKSGERVIIMIPMSPELYVTLLGVIRCGAVAVFVDPWIPIRQIAAFAAFAQPTGFIGITKSHLLRLFQPQLARIQLSITTGRCWLGLPARYSLRTLLQERTAMAPAAVPPEASALITFTSGSSGIPKGANRTHGFLCAQHDALCKELDYQADDIDMPMFPVFALRNLASGMTSVIPNMDFRHPAKINPEMIAHQIRTNRVTLLTASPPFIDRLSELPDPPQLRRIWTGGAPVSHAQLERWQKAFPQSEIEIIYGSTEAEPVAHISSRDRLATPEQEGFCCGKPTSLVQTRIIQIRNDAVSAEELEKLTCPVGEIGELIVSGNHVCRDYFNNPEAARENKITMPDNTCWHRMGDTGYFDREGRFFLTGRVHSTIRRHGKILHAQLVEAEVARRLPEAQRVAALEEHGQLLIVIQGPMILDAQQRIDADRILFTKKPLPVDPRHNSKIDYTQLRERLAKGDL
jgi:acyl-CoA synthetase (AMP-forming)/AMP-acid ligase II